MSIMTSLSNMLMQQMVQNMAINDVNRAYQAQGGKVNIYGNNSGLTNKQANSFSALAFASIFTSVLPLLKPLIQGLINGIVENKMKQAPPAPGQKSSVADQNLKADQKKTMSTLENNILKDQGLLNQIKDDAAIENLQKTANNTKYDDVKAATNKDSLKNYFANTNDIELDFSDINKHLNGITLGADIDDVCKYDKANIDNINNFGDIKNELEKNIPNHRGLLSNFEGAINKLSISADSVNFDTFDNIAGLNMKKIKLEDDVNNNPDNMELQDQLKKLEKEIDDAKAKAMDELNKSLAKKKDEYQAQINMHREALELYEEALNDVQLSLTDEQKQAIGKDNLTFDQLSEIASGEAEDAKAILDKFTDKDGNIDKDKLGALRKELGDNIAKNTSSLQLLDFANEKYKDLDNGSDISRKQARALRNKANELLQNGGTFADLQQYAAESLGITLSDPTNGVDTNKNGVANNWTNKATVGVKAKQTPAMGDLSSVTSQKNGSFDLGFNPTWYQNGTSGKSAFTNDPNATWSLIYNNENNDGTSISQSSDGRYLYGNYQDHLDDDSPRFINRIDAETFYEPGTGGFIDKNGYRIENVTDDMLSKAGFKLVTPFENVYEDSSGQRYQLVNGFLEKYSG